MSGLAIKTAWTVAAVSTTDLKKHLRLDSSFSADDTYISELESAVQNVLEAYLGRAITNQTLTLSLDALPYANNNGNLPEGFFTAPDLNTGIGHILLPKPPLSSVTSFKYYDDADSATTWAASNYYVDSAHEPGRIIPRDGSVFPTSSDLRVANAFEIEYVAGYGSSASDVPTSIHQAIKFLVANLYENREIVTDLSTNQIPKTMGMMLEPYKISRFGSSLGG